MASAYDITPERAIELIVGAATLLPSELIPVAEAFDRVLAGDVASLVDRPAADDSALDGFACRVSDSLGASPATPVSLELIGTVSAGAPFDGELAAGQAVRIATGGLLPALGPNREQAATADDVLGVVGVEHAGPDQRGRVVLTRPASADAVRPRGQDLRAGTTYLRSGQRLGSAAVGLAAAMGQPRLEVRRKPRVLLLATGDEVVRPGEAVGPGRLHDANGVALSAAAGRAGCDVIDVLYVPDDRGALSEALTSHVRSAAPPDLMITSGGVSRGERDTVRDLMLEEGELAFWRVNVRPAGPTMFGRFLGVPLLGLPGNPVSSLVGFLLFGRAFIDTALGCTGPLPYFDRFEVALVGSFEPQVKTILHRAHLDVVEGELRARAFDNQSSGVLRSLVEADVLVVTPPRGPTGQGPAAATKKAAKKAAKNYAETIDGPRSASAIDLRKHL